METQSRFGRRSIMKKLKEYKTKPLPVDEILLRWRKSVPSAIIEKQIQLSSRRKFMGQSVALLSALSLPAAVSAKTSVSNKSLTSTWLTILDVQNHLFPSKYSKDNKILSPGAQDFNAVGYLKVMLNTPDADEDEREFIIKGVSWLDGIADSMYGKAFSQLNAQRREHVIKRISLSDTGESWLSTLLRYIFEALLTDPVYGGNKNKMGWTWLEHQAGFPLPPKNKRYWLLTDKSNIKNKFKGAS